MLTRNAAKLDLSKVGVEPLTFAYDDGSRFDGYGRPRRYVQAFSPLPTLPSRAVDRVSNVPPR